MVYEKKCSECGKVLDFGGRELSDPPDDAMRFDGELYCKECVKRFVTFGTGNIQERMDEMAELIQNMAYQLGMEVDEV